MAVRVVLLAFVASASLCAVRAYAPPAGGLDPAFCSLFGVPGCAPSNPTYYPECPCPDGAQSGCQCGPYYLCENYQPGDDDRSEMLGVRMNGGQTCGMNSGSYSGDYMMECCKIRRGPAPLPPTTQESCGTLRTLAVVPRLGHPADGETDYGQFPWMVAIMNRGKYTCGGGLIAPGVVLTAAHCVHGKSAQDLQVRAGEWDFTHEFEPFHHQDRDVREIVIHCEYVHSDFLKNDVALLILNNHVDLGEHIGTICLPQADQDFSSATCRVSGWGKDRFGTMGHQLILRAVDNLPVLAQDTCQKRVQPYIPRLRMHRSMLCAGGLENVDVCSGDGGSPLVCALPGENPRYVLAGIVTGGARCGLPNIPGLYVNVPAFIPWINKQLGKRGLSIN